MAIGQRLEEERSDINLEDNELELKGKRKPLDVWMIFGCTKSRTVGGLRTAVSLPPSDPVVLFSIRYCGIHFVKARERGEKCRNAKHFFSSFRFSSVSEYSINVLEGFPFFFFYYSIRLLDSRPFSLFPMPSRFLSFFLFFPPCTHRLVVVVVEKAAVGAVFFFFSRGPKEEENTHSKSEVLVKSTREREREQGIKHASNTDRYQQKDEL